MSETQTAQPVGDGARRPPETTRRTERSVDAKNDGPGERGTTTRAEGMPASSKPEGERTNDKPVAGAAGARDGETATSRSAATPRDPRIAAPEATREQLQAAFADAKTSADAKEIRRPPAGDPRQAEASKAASPAKQLDPAAPADDIRQVVLRLGQLATELGRTDKLLARDIQTLAREVEQPGRTEEAKYRTRVAYAVQDVERQLPPLNLSPGLRTELKTLADTYPGLQNDRMRDLLAATGAVEHPRLVREVRAVAARIAGTPDQNDQRSMSTVDALDQRMRMSIAVADQTASAKPAVAAPQRVDATGGRREDAAQAARMPPAQQPPQGGPDQAQRGRVVLDVMAGLRRSDPDPSPAPWDRQLTPMGDRITAYSARMREGAEENAFRSAEKSGQAALSAMTAFSEGPGSALMARIRDAAKVDPNGMTGVLSEMREGGRHAVLRRRFNVALEQEKGFAAAYERAAGGVAKFGADRVEVEKIAAGRTDAAAITGRFQKLDAEIGKAASELPGKRDGKSFTDELADRASDIVRRAVDAVQTAFNRIRAGASPSPGPS